MILNIGDDDDACEMLRENCTKMERIWERNGWRKLNLLKMLEIIGGREGTDKLANVLGVKLTKLQWTNFDKI